MYAAVTSDDRGNPHHLTSMNFTGTTQYICNLCDVCILMHIHTQTYRLVLHI